MTQSDTIRIPAAEFNSLVCTALQGVLASPSLSRMSERQIAATAVVIATETILEMERRAPRTSPNTYTVINEPTDL